MYIFYLCVINSFCTNTLGCFCELPALTSHGGVIYLKSGLVSSIWVQQQPSSERNAATYNSHSDVTLQNRQYLPAGLKATKICNRTNKQILCINSIFHPQFFKFALAIMLRQRSWTIYAMIAILQRPVIA